jgi:hypothetical protein
LNRSSNFGNDRYLRIVLRNPRICLSSKNGFLDTCALIGVE